MVDAHHRLRPPSDRRSGHHRLAREGQADAAQLDRRIARRLRALHGRDPVRRRGHGDLHHPSRHAVRHHIRRGLPGAPPAGLRAGRLAGEHPRVLDRRLRHAEGGRDRLPPCGRGQDRQGPRGRGGREDGPVHRPVRHQPDHRRQAAAVHRRLRADGLRHRRDHGRAGRRPARLRLRRQVRPAGDLHGPAAAGIRRRPVRLRGQGAVRLPRRHRHQLLRGRHPRGRPAAVHRRPARGRRDRQGQRLAGTGRRGQGHRQLSPARLAVQPSTLLGRAVPDRLRRGWRGVSAAGRAAADQPAGRARLQPEDLRPGGRRIQPGGAAEPQRGVGQGHDGPGRGPEDLLS